MDDRDRSIELGNFMKRIIVYLVLLVTWDHITVFKQMVIVVKTIFGAK